MTTAQPGKTRFLSNEERAAAIAAANTELAHFGAANVIGTADLLRRKGQDAEVKSQSEKAMRFFDMAHIYRCVGQAA